MGGRRWEGQNFQLKEAQRLKKKKKKKNEWMIIRILKDFILSDNALEKMYQLSESLCSHCYVTFYTLILITAAGNWISLNVERRGWYRLTKTK